MLSEIRQMEHGTLLSDVDKYMIWYCILTDYNLAAWNREHNNTL